MNKPFSLEQNQFLYPIPEFFRDLKRETSRILRYKISYRILSKIFLMKKSKWYVNDLILRSKGDPDYILLTRMLNSYEKSLKSELGNNFKKLEIFFHKYKANLNNPKKESHPFLYNNYFEKINTKEKAYWFGWLLAEGNLTRFRLRIETNPKDGILIKRFVKDLRLNPSKVFFQRKYSIQTGKYYMSFHIEVSNRKLSTYLKDHGFIEGRKSEKIRFPNFSNKELAIACLLGFFDGDGSHSQGTPSLKSRSRDFLDDVHKKFHLPSYFNPSADGEMTIGGEFFNQLLDNYKRSLPRKRIKYKGQKGRFMWSKEEFQLIISEHPSFTDQELTDLHFKSTGINVADSTINEKLHKWNINKMSKDEYYRLKTIELCKKSWSLKRIYLEAFNLKRWSEHSAKFFRRIFKDDPLLKIEDGLIKDRIKVVYVKKT